jgi:predicted metal-dependent HD superfamily phosphohydrolase
MKSLQPENISYHGLPHTLNVEKAAVRYAKLEGVKNEDLLILRTATLFHDSGFIMQYDKNEIFGAKLAKAILPNFGYSDVQIAEIEKIILATQHDVAPETLLEKIMCDADHDYLGRKDYTGIAEKLRVELADFGTKFNEIEWIDFQINFLENIHTYHTETARNIREEGKKSRVRELKSERIKLINEQEKL